MNNGKAAFYANGVSLYIDPKTGRMGIRADQRGYRYLEQQAKAAGKTVDEFVRDVLADAMRSAGCTLKGASYSASLQGVATKETVFDADPAAARAQKSKPSGG